MWIVLLAQDRYQKILSILEKEGSVKATTLIKLFNVSMETIRRDLEHLEKECLLKRVYGGAVVDKINTKQVSFVERESEFINEKRELAELALRYISEGQSIALDNGTTNLEIAKCLKNKFQKLVVLTNSLMIINELIDMDKYTLILCGGIIKKDEFAVIGNLAVDNIGKFHIDTAFIGVSGISINEGLTDYDIEELQIQKKMIEVSQQVVILADSSKFDAISLLKVCDIDKIDMIITDSNLNPKVLDKYTKYGIEIINN